MPKSIIYFEDPFGKVKYQSDEDLENEIGTIIDSIRNSANTYTIPINISSLCFLSKQIFDYI